MSSLFGYHHALETAYLHLFVRIAALSLTSRFRLRNKVLSTRSRRDRDRNHVRRNESTECHGGTDFSCWRIVLEFASNTSTLRECVSTHPVIWTTNVAYLFCKNFTKCRSHRYPLPTLPPTRVPCPCLGFQGRGFTHDLSRSSALLLLDPFPEKFGSTGVRERALLLCR